MRLLSSLLLVAFFVPRPIPSVRVGITFYRASSGTNLACNGHVYDKSKEWVALPTEWFLGGFVDCGNTVYIKLNSGYTMDGVPAYDSGCMLHYGTWRDRDIPFAVDVPVHMQWLYGGFTTDIVELRIHAFDGDRWLDNFPLAAWDNINCDGPLTLGEEIWLVKPN